MYGKWRQLSRFTEWWGYKLAPLLAAGYWTALNGGGAPHWYWPTLLGVLASMVLGASFVSLLNDCTDIAADAAAGKPNRMAAVPPASRGVLLVAHLLAGGAFLWWFYDGLSCLLYAASWLLFAAYSVPPIRLKERGLAGLLADALGAHLFPALTMVATMAAQQARANEDVWSCLIGASACFQGLAGICWHQFSDIQADRRAGVSSFAVRVGMQAFAPYAILLGIAELALVLLTLWWYGGLWQWAALVVYLLLLARTASLDGWSIVVVLPKKGKQHFFLGLYHRWLIPLSLLLQAQDGSLGAFLLLLVHQVLFAQPWHNALYLLRGWLRTQFNRYHRCKAAAGIQP